MNDKILFGYMTFKDFICESFIPKVTDYGADLTNKEWKQLDNDFIVTFSKIEDYIYIIIYFRFIILKIKHTINDCIKYGTNIIIISTV